MFKDTSKRPSEDGETTVKKMRTQNEPQNEPLIDVKTRSREEDNDPNDQAKKMRLEYMTEQWDLGKGYIPKKITRLNIQKQEFFDYISTHKALSTTNLLAIRGYGNVTK